MADRRFKRFKADMQEVMDQPINQKDSVKSLAWLPVTCSWRGRICGVGAHYLR